MDKFQLRSMVDADHHLFLKDDFDQLNARIEQELVELNDLGCRGKDFISFLILLPGCFPSSVVLVLSSDSSNCLTTLFSTKNRLSAFNLVFWYYFVTSNLACFLNVS